ncbi:MAG: DUF4136 domain-containing protein, partial [Bacteroidales bacterium]|nr:DUF4136 domain-containing protein [Bacteroidales bacterium]
SQNQPLEEKKLAAVLEEILESKGLTRNKENPDLLVFLDFFSDKKEQYVPPTQHIQTRYRTVYNVWTKRYESRQYVTSSTEGDYTKTEYLISLDIIFMDAQKAKEDNSKVPPVIWSASYENISKEKPVLLNEVKNIYPVMLNFYPFVGWQYNFLYNDWGIYADHENQNRIAKVLPNSFAEKIGLQTGDIIKQLNKLKKIDFMFMFYGNYYCFNYYYKIKVERNGKTKSFKITYRPPTNRIVITLPSAE